MGGKRRLTVLPLVSLAYCALAIAAGAPLIGVGVLGATLAIRVGMGVSRSRRSALPKLPVGKAEPRPCCTVRHLGEQKVAPPIT